MGYNDLYHWGIKGMKWGVRRYQNEDGTLTPAGQKRYDRDVRENNAKKKDNRSIINGPDPGRWVKEDTQRTKDIVDSTASLVKQVDSMSRSAQTTKTKKNIDLSSMSDQELRDFINRTNLERQYKNAVAEMSAESVSRGRQCVEDALSIAGSVLAVGSSALGIALSIKNLKG